MHYTDRLETPRLMTRFATRDDIATWLDYCSDSVATTYTAIAGKTPQETAEIYIDTTLKRYQENRLGLQVLINKETREFIGLCGLLVQEVAGKREIEVGYHLLRRHWGKGYAIEAAQMFRDYAFEAMQLDSVISMIHSENMASQKVALRNGMRHTESSDFKSTMDASLNRIYYIFRITREEWGRMKK